MKKGADRKKILYLITKGNFGGAQRYVYDLATSLPKKDFDVCVAFGEGGVLKEKLAQAHIRTIEIPTLTRDVNMFLDFQTLIALIRVLRSERPDVVHLNSSKIGGLGGVAARIARIPRIIFTGHGWAWNEDRFILSKILIGLLHYITIACTHRTIAVSHQVQQQIARFPFIKKKISVIYNGTDVFPLKDGFEARQHICNMYDHSLWIGTISELHNNKGLDFLIDAFSSIAPLFPHAGLVIIGEGAERTTLTERIRRHNMTSRIHLIGYVENAKTYLKAFDIFTLTSRTEAFPYVLLEAGVASLPVVASNVGGIPEVVTHHSTGILVQKGNVPAIARELAVLLTNADIRTKYGDALHEKVTEYFSHTTMLEKTRALYA